MPTWNLDEETIKTLTADTLIHYGLDVVLIPADLPWQPIPNEPNSIPLSPRHLVVAGDTVTIRGRLRNHGKDVRIFARQLVFEADGAIDVSGPDPQKTYKPGDQPQQIDQSPGATGANGDAGGPGSAAGNISIAAETISLSGDLSQPRLVADGGRGSRGEDGHDGVQGAQGAAGKSGEDSTSDDNPPDTYGQKGLTGGAGGAPGKPGDGGAAGHITVDYVSLSGSFASSVTGGSIGPTAKGGGGGDGGKGGPGGNWTYTHYTMGAAAQSEPGPDVAFGWPITIQHDDPRTGPEGPRGDKGPDWSGTDPGANTGAAGTVLWNGAASPVLAQDAPEYTRLTPFAAVKQLLITQHAASNLYLTARSQDDYAVPVARFIWLSRLTAAAATEGFSAPGWSATDTATAAGIHDFAQTMLARFQAGLDFYGYPKDWVPIVNLQSYVERINQLTDIGKIIQDQYYAFVDQDKSDQEKITALQATYAQLSGDLDNVDKEIEALSGTGANDGAIHETSKLIADLTDRIQQQTVTIANDELLFTKEFKKWVEDRSCSFDDVLKCIGTIVAIGSSAMDGIGIIGEAAQLGNTLKETKGALDAAERALKEIKTVLSTIDDIRSSFSKLGDTFPAKPDEKDMALLAADKEKFDAFIDQYLGDFGAAQTLKDAVDDYFGMIDSRNQAILSYAAIYTQWGKLRARRAQLAAQIEEVGVGLNAATDPSLAIYLSFMRTAWTSAKADLLSRLYEAYRAKQYWTLDNDPFSASDLDMATLVQTFESLLKTIDAERLRQGPQQPFEGATIAIRADDYPLAFANLPSTRKLVFRLAPDLAAYMDKTKMVADTGPAGKSLRTDPFIDKYQVLVKSFTIDLPDIQGTSDDQINLSLIHPGSEVQVGKRDGAVFLAPAVHAPRTIPFTVTWGSAKFGGRIGDDYFYGLSPYATWTLDFDLPGNKWVDLTKIRTVNFVLTGNYYGS
jgi:hypothetical protein